MAPTIYHYDPATLLFTGAGVPMECPVEAGTWLLPAFCTQVEPPVAQEGHVARFDPEGQVWTVVPLFSAGEVLPFPLTSVAQALESLSQGVQAHLDGQAQSLGYDDILTAISYADEDAVPAFQAEGRALRAWRSQVWASYYELTQGLDEVQDVLHLPELEALVAQLPLYVPPVAPKA